MHPTTAYKILTADQWTQFQHDGEFHGAPIDISDGYIHLSTSDQITETADKHFSGCENLWVAAVDLDALGDAIRWEPSRGGQMFPHLYGSLPLSVIIAYGPLVRNAAEQVVLPVAG